MTAQVPDHVVYDRTRFDLVESDGTGLFDPAEHGLQVHMIHTACWRGYISEYTVKRDRLLLTSIQLGLDDPPRELFGAKVDRSSGVVYAGMKEPIPFTGTLVIGADFIRELYVHMGFAPAWKYERVHRLTFDEGELTAAEDLSRQMAELRERSGT